MNLQLQFSGFLALGAKFVWLSDECKFLATIFGVPIDALAKLFGAAWPQDEQWLDLYVSW